jgi:uncharacterized RDD family membrane protein YckC
MVTEMNAIAQVSAAPSTGPKLDNRRVLAGVVDLLIVTAGALVVLFAGDSLTGNRQGALVAVILGWALYYYFALESGDGQTVGKKLMKLRVVRADGSPAGMREIAVRTILRVVDGIGGYIVGLVVMLLTGERRQRIGDLAASTIVVDASGPATAVAEPAAPEAEAVPEDVEDVEDVEEEPVAAAPDPTRTITLPSRPEPPATLSDLADEADEAEPVVEAEPFEVEPFEVEPFHVEPIELEPVFPEEPAAEAEDSAVEVDEPAVEVEDSSVEVHEPAVDVEEQPLPQVTSPSLAELAGDVAAARETDADPEADVEDDQPMTVKSVETVSAMDLIMGAADEDAAKSDEDEGPATA